MDVSKLHVITVISNPIRYCARYALFKKFEQHMIRSGVDLYLVECAFGDRPFVVSDPDNPRHLRVRSTHELWHKENMINLGIQNIIKLSPDAEYIAWIDADVEFVRKDWAMETIQQLQHHQVIQLWQEAIDLGPSGQFMQKHDSFCYAFIRDRIRGPNYGKFWHTGYAWAARRETLDKVGGLFDMAILGSSDHNMAKAMIGIAETSVHGKMHPNFLKHLRYWQHRALKHIRKDLGFVAGIILHGWHGSKVNRGYVDRWKILVNNQYDPETDIVKDTQGLWQLTDDDSERSILLRDQIRAYFRQRNEDSIDC